MAAAGLNQSPPGLLLTAQYAVGIQPQLPKFPPNLLSSPGKGYGQEVQVVCSRSLLKSIAEPELGFVHLLTYVKTLDPLLI